MTTTAKAGHFIKKKLEQEYSLCVCFELKAIFIQIQFQNHYFGWKNTEYEKEEITAWASDIVPDSAKGTENWHLEMFLFSCPPRKSSFKNCQKATQFSLIFWCNIDEHNKNSSQNSKVEHCRNREKK